MSATEKPRHTGIGRKWEYFRGRARISTMSNTLVIMMCDVQVRSAWTLQAQVGQTLLPVVAVASVSATPRGHRPKPSAPALRTTEHSTPGERKQMAAWADPKPFLRHVRLRASRLGAGQRGAGATALLPSWHPRTAARSLLPL